MTNEQQMDIMKNAILNDHKGTFTELWEQAEAAENPNVETAETQQEQEQGLRGQSAEQMPDAMVFPQSQGDFNTMGMQAPIDVEKYNQQGDLVQSYENVPPSLENLPMGDDVGTVIERPSEYQDGGFEEQEEEYDTGGYHKLDDIIKYRSGGCKHKYQNAGFKVPTTQLDVRAMMNQQLNQPSTLDTNPAAFVQQKIAVEEAQYKLSTDKYNEALARLNSSKSESPTVQQAFQARQDAEVVKSGPLSATHTINEQKRRAQEMQESTSKHTLIGTTQKNLQNALGNSFFASQIAGGYGKKLIDESLSNPDTNFEETYSNLLSGTGTNTMQQVALGVTGAGAGAKLGSAGGNTFINRALNYPMHNVGKNLQGVISSGASKEGLAQGLKGLYNWGYVTGVPKSIGGLSGSVMDYATGEKSAGDAALAFGKNALNFVPAVRGFNADKYGTTFNMGKDLYKAGYDVKDRNYANAALRLAARVPGIGSVARYSMKHLRRVLPKGDEWQQDWLPSFNTPRRNIGIGLPLSVPTRAENLLPKRIKPLT